MNVIINFVKRFLIKRRTRGRIRAFKEAETLEKVGFLKKVRTLLLSTLDFFAGL